MGNPQKTPPKQPTPEEVGGEEAQTGPICTRLSPGDSGMPLWST